MKPSSNTINNTSGPCITNLGIGRRVEFGGQFGNQLFQIAAVLGQAQRMGLAARFAPWYCEFSDRDYGALYPDLQYSKKIRVRNSYRQPDFSYSPLPLLADCDLRGTFQNPRFFCDTDCLRQLFSVPKSISPLVDKNLKSLGEEAFCVVHLRFYDNAKRDAQPLISCLPEHYTLRAIEKVSTKLPLLLISDNPHRASLFAQRYLKTRRVLTTPVVEDSLVDFYLMTHATEMVISNSTFAWWAAFLNVRAEKIFAPVQRKWLSFFAAGLPAWQAPTDFYPENFTEVEF
jgi:Glycosyl transferase family 11